MRKFYQGVTDELVIMEVEKMGKKRLRKTLSLLIGIIIIAFLLQYIWKCWDSLQAGHLVLKLDMLVISYIFGLLSFLAYSVPWFILIGTENPSVGFIGSNYMLAKGNLGKYIPGRVWQFVSRLYLFNEMGFSKGKIVMIAIVEQYLLLLSAFIIFGVSCLISPQLLGRIPIPFLEFIIVGGMIVGIISLHPKGISFWNQILLRITRKQSFQLSISSRQLLLAFVIFSIYWIFTGLSALFLVMGGMPGPTEYVFFIVGANAIAYIIGYLSLITPNGLGIREGVLTYLLETVLLKGFGAIVSITSRLMLIACEIGYFFIAFFLYKFNERRAMSVRGKIKEETVSV